MYVIIEGVQTYLNKGEVGSAESTHVDSVLAYSASACTLSTATSHAVLVHQQIKEESYS